MHLGGAAMWWMPEWLDKRLPRLHIEAEEHPEDDDETEVEADEREREAVPR
jgi:RND superfamily putative drug exporter